MSSKTRRENTFRIEFANLPKKPRFEDIHQFIKNQLGLSRDKIVRLQINHYYWCVFVKCVDLATASDTVRQHHDKHVIEIDGKKYTINIQMEDGATEVLLTDLSEHVTDHQIATYMSKFGDVLTIRELPWEDKYELAGLPSGKREVKMILKQPIKSFVTIAGEVTMVKYIGQLQTCRHCGEKIHNGIPCSQNKKLLAQKMSVNDRLDGNSSKTSYAGAVKGGSSIGSSVPVPILIPTPHIDDDLMETDNDNDNTATATTETLTSVPDKSGPIPSMSQPSLQETIIIADTNEEIIFKAPLAPVVPNNDDDGETTDASSTSTNTANRESGSGSDSKRSYRTRAKKNKLDSPANQ